MAETEAKEPKNLYQKLAKIRQLVDVVKKDKDGYKFKYPDIVEILAKVKGGMNRYGVSLIPTVVPGSSSVMMQEMITKKAVAGDVVDFPSYEYLFSSDMVFVWVNDDDPEERIEIPWHVTGSQADPSQAYGSALTYCTRYFLQNYFQIAQDNDVDGYRKKQKEAEESEDRDQAAETIKSFDVALRAYMADHPEKHDELLEFVGRYAKEGKYKQIKEPLLATKLLNDFQEKYLSTDGSKKAPN